MISIGAIQKEVKQKNFERTRVVVYGHPNGHIIDIVEFDTKDAFTAQGKFRAPVAKALHKISEATNFSIEEIYRRW